MRAFILLLAITIAAADSPNDACPAVDGDLPVYLPHKDCNKYYECSNGVAYLFTCDGNLVFNRELNVCDWPSNVNCSSGDVPVVPPEPEPAYETTTENSHRTTSKAPVPAESTTERWVTFSVETTSENSDVITTFLPDETTEAAATASTESDESSSDSHRSSEENSDDLTTFLPDETTEIPLTASTESNESSSDSHRSSEESNESTSTNSAESHESTSDPHKSSEESRESTSEASTESNESSSDSHRSSESKESSSSESSSSDSHKSSEESKDSSSSESSESSESSSNSRKSSEESKESSSSDSSESSDSSSDSSESSDSSSDSSESIENDREIRRDCHRHRNRFFLRPHPSSCTKYIACDHGKVDIMPCPKGLYFSPIIHVCVKPELSGCKLEPLAA